LTGAGKQRPTLDQTRATSAASAICSRLTVSSDIDEIESMDLLEQ